MQIIIDYKRKRKISDDQWKDPLGIDEAQKAHSQTIEISSKSENVIDKFLLIWQSPKMLLGKKVYALRDDKTVMSGRVVDVWPSRFVLIKDNKGDNRPVEFGSVISME